MWVRRAEKRGVVPEVQLLELEEEEDKDVEGIRVLVEQNERVFKLFFNKCASSQAGGHTFGQTEERQERLSLAALSKWLSEHGVTQQMLSHSEVSHSRAYSRS